jgi:hypothetical protein
MNELAEIVTQPGQSGTPDVAIDRYEIAHENSIQLSFSLHSGAVQPSMIY